MAAVIDVNNADRYNKWYDPDISLVNQDIRNLLQNYSHIEPDEVIPHINKIRSLGFHANPYPCIGQYRFLNLTLLTHPRYNEILHRLKTDPDAVYLDIGCCFGQDLRQLVQDGVPSRQLTGLDIEAPLMELGYEFFVDRETLESEFVVADVFAGGDGGVEGQKQNQVWSRLSARGADVVHCSAFFHLFPLDEQKRAAEKMVELVRVGGVIVGRQSGSTAPGEVPAIKAGSTSFRHDVETWREFWAEVGEKTGTRWAVEGSLDTVGLSGAKKDTVEDGNSRRLLFTVERLA